MFTIEGKDSETHKPTYRLAKIEEINPEMVKLRFSEYVYFKNRYALESAKDEATSDLSEKLTTMTMKEFENLKIETVIK